MYLVIKCEDVDGNTMYDPLQIIGVYENYENAKKDLLTKLKSLKYECEVLIDDDNSGYYFTRVESIKGKEIMDNPVPCFEIMELPHPLNTELFIFPMMTFYITIKSYCKIIGVGHKIL